MAFVAQLVEIGAMTDVEAGTLAYLEAAQGDIERALAFAVEDVLRLEADLVVAFKVISTGYVRGSISVP